MSESPKLKVEYTVGGAHEEKICDLEQAKNFLYGSCGSQALVVVEGQAISSYKELVQLAAQNQHKGKEVLNVVLIVPPIGGG